MTTSLEAPAKAPQSQSAPRVALYTRVSTEDQVMAPQLMELHEYTARMGWTQVEEFSDVISGKTASRDGLDALVESAEAGNLDVVCVVKLDRLGRSLLNVIRLVERLDEAGCALICTSQGIDTRSTSPCGKMILGMLAVVAEFERGIISERTVAGLKVAKAAGKTIGRPSEKLVPEWREIVAQWQAEGGKGVRNLAARLGGVSTATAARLGKVSQQEVAS